MSRSEFLALPPNPSVVLLHDADHGDHYLPLQRAGLEPSYTVRGFIDRMQGPTPENSGLHLAVGQAEILFIQSRLIDPKTADAHLALCSLRMISLRGFKTRAYQYGDDYSVEYLRPSEVRDLTLSGWDFQDSAEEGNDV